MVEETKQGPLSEEEKEQAHNLANIKYVTGQGTFSKVIKEAKKEVLNSRITLEKKVVSQENTEKGL